MNIKRAKQEIKDSIEAYLTKDEAVKIYEVLKTKDIEKARVQVSYIVGRDTAHGSSVVCRLFGCSHKYGGFKRWRWF